MFLYFAVEGSAADAQLLSHQREVAAVPGNAVSYGRALQGIKGSPLSAPSLTETICSAFLYDLSPDTEDFPGQQTDEDVVNRGRTIIRQTLSQDISIQDVARQLNVSYSYFRKHFKAYTGYSPAYYQQFLRLQMAKEMLQNTSATVAEVAYHFQFSSPDYFSYRFKEVLGESPSCYKRK